MNATPSIKDSNFLSSGNPVPKYSNKVVEIPSHKKWTPDQLQSSYLSDCEHMTATQLRKKYGLTYSSWKNMKQRVKEGAVIHQDFADFRSFLKIVGPRLHANYTLERLNNNDKEYAPDKVEWRDKYAQNSNKGNNVWLTDGNGVSHTVAQWAAIKGISASAIHKRITNGWTHHEAIHGKDKASTVSASEWSDTPWPVGKELAWEESYQNRLKVLNEPISRECHFFNKANVKHESARALSLELWDKIYGFMSTHCETRDDEEYAYSITPSELRSQYEIASADYEKWKALLHNAKAHYDHQKHLDKLSNWGGGKVTKEKQKFLLLNPKPQRCVLAMQKTEVIVSEGQQLSQTYS